MQKKDKLTTDIQRILNTQDFKSKEKMQAFLNVMMKDSIPEFPKEALNEKEQAENLVFEAYELSLVKAMNNITEALRLDRECIRAYEFLGDIQPDDVLSMIYYEKGISIGWKLFDETYIEIHRAGFWGMQETRPFMRCLFNYSECLYTLGEKNSCVAIQEKMLEINPTDNQGIRDFLMLYLIELDHDQKFLKYDKQYKNDFLASALFNRALFYFKTKGNSPKSNNQLKKAIGANKHITSYLISKKEIHSLPEHYALGSPEEALIYADYARTVWKKIEGAIQWLKAISNDK